MTPQINSPQIAPVMMPVVDPEGFLLSPWLLFFNLVGLLMQRFLGPVTFANLPAANALVNGVLVNQGKFAIVTDSNTVTWGATIAGGGANYVLAFCDGVNWTVVAK